MGEANLDCTPRQQARNRGDCGQERAPYEVGDRDSHRPVPKRRLICQVIDRVAEQAQE
jgi:hypothetical protein